MKHLELQRAVWRIIKEKRLYAYEARDSRRAVRGWPDITVIGTRLLYREMKTGGGKLTSEQRHVGYLLQAAGQDWAVWRECDLVSGRIARELGSIAR
jgi:hypothetical protein